MSDIKRETTWTVTVYRTDSETPVVYDRVKHTWWEGTRLVISQYTTTPQAGEHHYWIWPGARIGHVKVAREKSNG